MTKENRQKIRERMLGNKLGVGNTNRRGSKISEETRRKLSESHKGFHPTKETRRKMSESNKRLGIRPPSWLGKHQSPEYILRLKKERKGAGNPAWKGGVHSDPEHRKERQRIWQKQKALTDPTFKLKMSLRGRMYKVLKGIVKVSPTLTLVGCTVEELWIHLEKQFKPGMTRENYGLWHVDHIKPLSAFNLFIPEQQMIAFHFTNLQPLWAKENLSKGPKYNQT